MTEILENWPEFVRLSWELISKLHPDEAGFLCLAETCFERDVAADFRHVVIGPADGVRPDTDHCFVSRFYRPTGTGAKLVADILQLPPLFIGLACCPNLLARTHFGYGDIPPETTGLCGNQWVSFNDDHRRSRVRLRGSKSRFQPGDRRYLLGNGAHAGGMRGEVDIGQRLVPRILQKIVEVGTAGRHLQP